MNIFTTLEFPTHNSDFYLRLSSPGTFDLPATFAGYEALTSCIYKRKNLEVKTAGGTYLDDRGTYQDGVQRKRRLKYTRQHARGHKLQRCRHGVGPLIYLYCAWGYSVQAHNRYVLFIYILFSRGHSFP